jgi:hypothetical protein
MRGRSSMSGVFDPYHKWLGIRPEEQPPNHYRLLGVVLFEDDPEAIENAADRQMAHLRTFQLGTHVASCQQLLNEVAAAKVCLLDRSKRAAYDEILRQQLGIARVSNAPEPPQLDLNMAAAYYSEAFQAGLNAPGADTANPEPQFVVPPPPAAIEAPVPLVVVRPSRRSRYARRNPQRHTQEAIFYFVLVTIVFAVLYLFISFFAIPH